MPRQSLELKEIKENLESGKIRLIRLKTNLIIILQFDKLPLRIFQDILNLYHLRGLMEVQNRVTQNREDFQNNHIFKSNSGFTHINTKNVSLKTLPFYQPKNQMLICLDSITLTLDSSINP